MMGLALSPAAAALLRALLKGSGEEQHRILLTGCRSAEWQSLTFLGERHTLQFRIAGPDAAALFTRFVAGLAEREFAIAGNLVADIAAGAPRPMPDGSIEVDLEALTIAN